MTTISPTLAASFVVLPVTILVSFIAANFFTDINVTYGGDRVKILDNGNLLQLSLDNTSGSGFQTKQEYLYGKIDMQIKVVPGDSAGTVTAYYLSSQGPMHDEIDFEFLGNVTGEPYVLHTNIYVQGNGNREQQFYLWFDPRLDFHTYSILWNPKLIIFYVDDAPVRVFQNAEGQGVPYPENQPMRIYSSLWAAEDWATRGGLVKTNWTNAPFIANYRDFKADACIWYGGGKTSCSSAMAPPKWWDQSLDDASLQKLKEVRKNYMIYDYCRDTRRFPQGFPIECSLPVSQ